MYSNANLLTDDNLKNLIPHLSKCFADSFIRNISISKASMMHFLCCVT